MTSLQAARLATMGLLFCNGLIYATWGIHIPTLKEKFSLSDATLSQAMFAVAIGGIIIMPQIGRWAGQTGTARVSRLSAWFMAVTAALILIIPDYNALLIWLLLFGAATAANDVAVNAQAAMLEVRMSRPIMGSVHGSFSLGGLTGAMIASLWAAQVGSPAWHFFLVAAVMAVLMTFATRYLVRNDHQDPEKTPDQYVPNLQKVPPPPVPTTAFIPHSLRRRLWALGVLGFLGLLIEGAMYDWSAVYMRDVVAATPAMVSAGYAAFCAGMAVGRFGGDPLRARLGALQLMYSSCCLAGLGLLLALLWQTSWSVVIGFGLTGLGLSSVMPITFASAGKMAADAGIIAAIGLAVTVRLAYIGLLLGPALLGQISQLFGLVVALALTLLALVLIVGISAYLLKE
ncbi:MAG: MFS transporter [Burkholderiales bacterium]|jgi:MFS family permease